MTKPWLETWLVVMGVLKREVRSLRDSEMVLMGHATLDEPRQQLAAAAPALVRALLATEWSGGRPIYDIYRPDPPAPTLDRHCPVCGRPRDGGPHRTAAMSPKKGDCSVDAALTAAGLPTQALRDEMRAELTKR
jgi:hypothetical protein